MILFGIGTGQVKLQATPAASQYPGGDVKAVTGLRVFTFFYPDEAALSARFTAKGYPAPSFSARAGGGRSAMVLDPEKQWVELVVIPNASADTYQRLEVGITTSNLDKSRAFYRSFVGLEELPPVVDPVLGTTKYPFRHGETTDQRLVVRVRPARQQEQRGHPVRRVECRGRGRQGQSRVGDDRPAARRVRSGTAHHLAVRSRRRDQLLRADPAAPPRGHSSFPVAARGSERADCALAIVDGLQFLQP